MIIIGLELFSYNFGKANGYVVIGLNFVYQTDSYSSGKYLR